VVRKYLRMGKKILIIFNPAAGLKYKKNFQNRFLNCFKKYLPQTDYDWLDTTLDFKQQLTGINLSNYRRIIAVGGDGTVKNIADFLLTHNLDIPLAIVPQGSANVLASSLNIPVMFNNAIKTACLGKEKKIDVCLLNNQEYILIGLTIGYWSKIVKETKRGLKIRLGALAYLITLLKQRKIYNTDFTFNLDGQLHQVTGNTMVVANTLSIFKLQPRTPVDLFDGQLEVLICKNKSFIGFFLLLFSFFLGKRRFPYLFKAKGKKIIIDYQAKEEKKIQIDGETMEPDDLPISPQTGRTTVTVETIPHKLTIVTNGQNS